MNTLWKYLSLMTLLTLGILYTSETVGDDFHSLLVPIVGASLGVGDPVGSTPTTVPTDAKVNLRDEILSDQFWGRQLKAARDADIDQKRSDHANLKKAIGLVQNSDEYKGKIGEVAAGNFLGLFSDASPREDQEQDLLGKVKEAIPTTAATPPTQPTPPTAPKPDTAKPDQTPEQKKIADLEKTLKDREDLDRRRDRDRDRRDLRDQIDRQKANQGTPGGGPGGGPNGKKGDGNGNKPQFSPEDITNAFKPLQDRVKDFAKNLHDKPSPNKDTIDALRKGLLAPISINNSGGKKDQENDNKLNPFSDSSPTKNFDDPFKKTAKKDEKPKDPSEELNPEPQAPKPPTLVRAEQAPVSTSTPEASQSQFALPSASANLGGQRPSGGGGGGPNISNLAKGSASSPGSSPLGNDFDWKAIFNPEPPPQGGLGSYASSFEFEKRIKWKETSSGSDSSPEETTGQGYATPESLLASSAGRNNQSQVLALPADMQQLSKGLRGFLEGGVGETLMNFCDRQLEADQGKLGDRLPTPEIAICSSQKFKRITIGEKTI